jgi:hypothetical protein
VLEVLQALGGDLDEILEHLDAWSEAIIAAGSSPKRIFGAYNVGGGPHSCGGSSRPDDASPPPASKLMVGHGAAHKGGGR